jgi:hypothetical protein
LGYGFSHGEERVIYLVIESNSSHAYWIEYTIKKGVTMSISRKFFEMKRKQKRK